jgi:protein farnesyltransferase subunit beta
MLRLTPIDAYPTETSDLQADTEHILQDQVPPDDGPDGRVLHKNDHVVFLIRNLTQGFPARYMGQDASQPWLLFWTLQSFSTLQVAIDPDSKQRCPNLRCCVMWAFCN